MAAPMKLCDVLDELFAGQEEGRSSNSGPVPNPPREGEVSMTSVPTPAQIKKYSDYSVEIERSEKLAPIKRVDGRTMKMCARFFRIPSSKIFEVRIFAGLDEREARVTERWGRELPAGQWAVFPDRWYKHRRADGTWFWSQGAGYYLPEMDAVDLELRMMLPSSIDLSVGINHIPVL